MFSKISFKTTYKKIENHEPTWCTKTFGVPVFGPQLSYMVHENNRKNRRNAQSSNLVKAILSVSMILEYSKIARIMYR